MIEDTVARWHQHLRGQLPGGLDELLADDVVFVSPIVFTPQQGKEITKAYLHAAMGTLGGDGESAVTGTSSSEGGFRYTKQVMSGSTAVLEFETTLDGTHVNGVDIITCDDDGRIVEFKVMVRPLKAVNAVHAQMAAALGAPPPG